MDEFIIPFLTGTATKLYDDVNDQKLFGKYPIIIEILKSFLVSLNTLFLSSDFEISLLHLIVLPTCFLAGQIDNVFWKSLVPLPIFTTLYSTKYIQHFDLTQGIKFIIFSIITIISILLESLYFPEEFSTKKILFRIFLILILNIVLIFLKNSFIRKMLIFGIGYFVVSIVFQFYLLYNDNDENKDTIRF